MTTAATLLAIWALGLLTIFGGIACWAAIHDRRHRPTFRPIEPVTDDAIEAFISDLETNPPPGGDR